jgi:hypothetical protein
VTVSNLHDNYIFPSLNIKELSLIKPSIILISPRLQEVPQSSLRLHPSRIPDRAMTKFHSEALSDVTLLHQKDPCGMEIRAINCLIRCEVVVLFQDNLARLVGRDMHAAPDDYPKWGLYLNGRPMCCRCHDLARRTEDRG